MTTGEVIALIKAFGGGGGSSGGGVLYVTISQDKTTLDKNFEEIQGALDAGKTVVLKQETSDNGVLYHPLISTHYYPKDPYYGVIFYIFATQRDVTFSNETSPTDPLVYQE